MQIEFRGMTPEDFEVLVPMAEAFTRERAAGMNQRLRSDFTDTVAVMLEQALVHPTVFVLGAVVDGQLIGYATAAIQEPPPLFVDRPFLFVSDLYVRPEWRGKGVGTSLVERLQGFGFLRGISRLSMVVPLQNTAACRIANKMNLQQLEGLFFWQDQPE